MVRVECLKKPLARFHLYLAIVILNLTIIKLVNSKHINKETNNLVSNNSNNEYAIEFNKNIDPRQIFNLFGNRNFSHHESILIQKIIAHFSNNNNNYLNLMQETSKTDPYGYSNNTL